ncbi:MAG: hypothetical protein ACF8SC_05600 [Phycisphaerales bacterium JB037]
MKRRANRRGVIIAASVLLIGVLNIVVVGSVRPGVDEALVSEARVQRVRAFHAAESILRVVASDLIATGEPPDPDLVVEVGPAEAGVIAAPPDGGPGEFVLEGRAGSARRRLSVIID